MPQVIAQHTDYPHFPGTLFDCPACEAECFCCPSQTQCVRCAIADETQALSQKEIAYLERLTF